MGSGFRNVSEDHQSQQFETSDGPELGQGETM